MFTDYGSLLLLMMGSAAWWWWWWWCAVTLDGAEFRCQPNFFLEAQQDDWHASSLPANLARCLAQSKDKYKQIQKKIQINTWMKRRLVRFPFWQKQRQLALLLQLVCCFFACSPVCCWWKSQGVVCQSPNSRKEVWPAHNFTKKICISFVLVGLVPDYRSSCGSWTG